jgi:hypothetical protein
VSGLAIAEMQNNNEGIQLEEDRIWGDDKELYGS